MKPNSKLMGGLELLFAAMLYGSYGLFYRYISDFGSFSQGWVRAIIMIIVFGIVFLMYRNKWRNYEKKDMKWFAMWIVPSSFQPILTFLAFNNLPTGLVYFLVYAAIILSSFISGTVFYKEKLNITKILALISVMVGLLIIYRSNLSLELNIYVLFAFLSGFLLGFWNTLTKKLSDKYSGEQMIFSDNLGLLFVSLLLTFVFKESLPIAVGIGPWIWIMAFSLVSIFTGILIVRGYNKIEAQVGSLILPTEIVFGALFGYIFFQENLGINIYIGGLFIFLAAIIPYISKSYSNN